MKSWTMMPEWFVPSFLQQVSGSRGEMETGTGCEMIPNNQFRELEGWVCLLLAVLQGCSWQLETQWEEEAGKSSQTLQQLLFLIPCEEFHKHISKFWITDLETWAVPCDWAPPAAMSLQLALWQFHVGDARGNCVLPSENSAVTFAVLG